MQESLKILANTTDLHGILKLLNYMSLNECNLPKIALVIPVYNEEENIESVILNVERMKHDHPQWNIVAIIVNDGSKDKTQQILDHYEEAKWHWIRIIHLALNLGIGRAVQTGFIEAINWGADIVLQLDGDGQHPADQVPKLIEPILAGKSDVVVGSRYIPGAGGNVSTLPRQVGTWCFSILLFLLVRLKLSDTTSGFRAFSRPAANLISIYYADDYPEVEAYVVLARSQFRILEVPTVMRGRQGGISSITFVQSLYYVCKVVLSTLINMLRPIPSSVERRARSNDS